MPRSRGLQLPLQLDVGEPDWFDISLDGLDVSSVVGHILRLNVEIMKDREDQSWSRSSQVQAQHMLVSQT